MDLILCVYVWGMGRREKEYMFTNNNNNNNKIKIKPGIGRVVVDRASEYSFFSPIHIDKQACMHIITRSVWQK
ncbi:hypothetical protein BLA29_010260 [Euroglyphus maynei]|uniref:Uncharacterized protein n=1 Tax=Euroglyphus maynei TaxID=6958 RepID=A0A1Y3BJS1_EURMA|nr:hypothetical protein BLA29_010260 [Euroglyphus maynei]